MEHPLVKELRDRAAQRSKTESESANQDPFEWRKTTPEWRAADELEKYRAALNTIVAQRDRIVANGLGDQYGFMAKAWNSAATVALDALGQK